MNTELVHNQDLANEYPWNPATVWWKRTKMFARLVPHDCQVIDIGGGYGHLYDALKNKDGYVSIDVKPWTNLTVTGDLNSPDWPDVGAAYMANPFVVCQGVLEYINDPGDFLVRIRGYSRNMLISYHLGTTGKNRKNNLEYAELETLLDLTGWRIIGSYNVLLNNQMPIEKIYFCTC